MKADGAGLLAQGLQHVTHSCCEVVVINPVIETCYNRSDSNRAVLGLALN